FAYQYYDISPDIITSAKGLGNGFPTGAMIGKEKLFNTFNPGSHGSTFGGNYLAMSAAKATLEVVFNEEFLTEVQEKGQYLYQSLSEKLKDVDSLLAIRHKGLMFGLEFSEEVSQLLRQLRENELIVL